MHKCFSCCTHSIMNEEGSDKAHEANSACSTSMLPITSMPYIKTYIYVATFYKKVYMFLKVNNKISIPYKCSLW